MGADLSRVEIDQDIARASTLPGSSYRDPEVFEVCALSYVWDPAAVERETGVHHFHRLLVEACG